MSGRMEISVHRGGFNPSGSHAHAPAGSYILSYSKWCQPRLCGHQAQTYDLLISRSPHLSFSSRPYVHTCMDLYTADMRASCLQIKTQGRQCYFSQKIGTWYDSKLRLITPWGLCSGQTTTFVPHLIAPSSDIRMVSGSMCLGLHTSR